MGFAAVSFAPMTRKLYIRTFGCQMNEYDSARTADLLGASHGLERTDDPAQADVLLVNTCSVREKAAEKLLHFSPSKAIGP